MKTESTRAIMARARNAKITVQEAINYLDTWIGDAADPDNGGDYKALECWEVALFAIVNMFDTVEEPSTIRQ